MERSAHAFTWDPVGEIRAALHIQGILVAKGRATDENRLLPALIFTCQVNAQETFKTPAESNYSG